jgi:nucleoside 2-deoxyribosyltransferase
MSEYAIAPGTTGAVLPSDMESAFTVFKPVYAPAPKENIFIQAGDVRKFYLSSRFSRREELRGYAEQLRAQGHDVTSRWLFEDHRIPDAGDPRREEFAARFAREDFDDIDKADFFVAFTEPVGGSLPGKGGCHVELGYALNLGIEIAVVGPRVNVFHYLPEVAWYATWDEFLTWAGDITRKIKKD